MSCDLHTHSCYSDGSDTPEELVVKAKNIGLTAVALTDHNTVSGINEFVLSCEKHGVKAVPGVEVSTAYNGTELHILALFVKKEDCEKITQLLEHFLSLKEKSNIETVERLNKDGINVNYAEIKKTNPEGRINRFHIAKALMDKGYVKTVKQAMETLLSPENKYYTPPERVQSLDIIRFIKSLVCVAVLAHPLISMSEEMLKDFLSFAIDAGLDAMETEYTLYDESTTLLARKIAEEYGLIKSGGSDYHGVNKPEIFLGAGNGALSVPDSTYFELLNKVKN